jgi:hypothetical protein
MNHELQAEVERATQHDRDLRSIPPLMAQCNFEFKKETMTKAQFMRVLGNKVHLLFSQSLFCNH